MNGDNGILPSGFKKILTSTAARTGGTPNSHKILMNAQGSKSSSLTDHHSVPFYGFNGAMSQNKTV